MESQRKIAAKAARQLLAKQISYEQFLDAYPEETKDNDIEKLFSLIEHQPSEGGLLGLGKDHYEQYTAQIIRAIELLEKTA
jgi:hypothetical protein